jgi:hypothetical protein
VRHSRVARRHLFFGALFSASAADVVRVGAAVSLAGPGDKSRGRRRSSGSRAGVKGRPGLGVREAPRKRRKLRRRGAKEGGCVRTAEGGQSQGAIVKSRVSSLEKWGGGRKRESTGRAGGDEESGPLLPSEEAAHLRRCIRARSHVREVAMSAGTLGNFVPRRALPLVSREPTLEWQEAAAASDPEPEPKHRTVVYFGDTGRRERETPSEEDIVEPTLEENSPGFRCPGESRPEEVVREIVVSVKPCRADVLRIEEARGDDLEDDCELSDQGSPSKADWSFVQQWRLRG